MHNFYYFYKLFWFWYFDETAFYNIFILKHLHYFTKIKNISETVEVFEKKKEISLWNLPSAIKRSSIPCCPWSESERMRAFRWYPLRSFVSKYHLILNDPSGYFDINFEIDSCSLCGKNKWNIIKKLNNSNILSHYIISVCHFNIMINKKKIGL